MAGDKCDGDKTYMQVNRQKNLYFILSTISEYRERKFNIYKKKLFVVTKRVIKMVIFWWHITTIRVKGEVKHVTSRYVLVLYVYVCLMWR